MKTYNKRRSGGFTLAETLMTVLILLMVSSVLAAGIPVAVRAYDKVIDAANAQLLLSTTVSRLEEELSTAVEVWMTGEGTSKKLEGFSHYQGGYKIMLKSEDKEGIQLEYSQREAADGMQIPKKAPLVTGQTETLSKAKETKFYVQFKDISYADGVFTVTELKVTKKDGGSTPVKLDHSLEIRTVKTPTEIPVSSTP